MKMSRLSSVLVVSTSPCCNSVYLFFFFFFFSSRRRHTRFKCDWSSDVCSSDLDLCADWASIERCRRTSQHKDPCADNGPDPQGDQIYRSQRALQTVLSSVARFLHQRVKRLGCEQRVAHATPPLGGRPRFLTLLPIWP